MKPMPLPDTAYLEECFAYSPETGEVMWLERPREHFGTENGWRTFNSQYAGTYAGSINKISGRRIVRINGVKHHLSRVIWKLMTGNDPEGEIDHINHDSSDDRWDNLREVTHAENLRNQSMRSTNTSGYMGVSRDGNRWRAQVEYDSQLYRSPYLPSPESADEWAVAKRAELGFHPNHGATA